MRPLPNALLAVLCAAACRPGEGADGDDGAARGGGGVDFAGRSRARLDVVIETPRKGDAAAAAAKLARARDEFQLGRPEAALKLTAEALELDPAHLDTLLFRGTLLLAKGMVYDPSLALLAFRVALRVDPACVAARVGEAVARVELEDDERAEQLALAILADDAGGRGELGHEQRAALRRSIARVALRAARFDDALREVDAARTLHDRDRASILLRAEILERTDRAEEAVIELQRAISQKPEDASAHFASARLLRRLGRIEEAAKALRIYQALLPFEQEAAKAFRTEWPRRIALRRELVAAWPEYRRGRHQLVRELIGARELEEARAELQRLLDEQPGDAEAWFLMARTLAKAGDREGARAAADRMLATGAVKRVVHDDLLHEIEKGADGER